MYEPGTLVAGKYRVEGVIGRGGMGTVLAAQHIDLRTPVALKLLAERFIDKPVAVERFLREARAAAKLKDEHVCRVFDVARTDDGTPMIVMERLEGRDLSKLLRASGAIPIAVAASYIAQACGALAEAHTLGIIHRDLKPGNLFLAERPDGTHFIKVLDFGVAKAHGEDGDLTGTDNVMGSPHYMAPEQLRSAKACDARSDIWSLGVILCELTTGKTPFSGETLIDLAMRISNEPPTLTTTGMPPLFVAVLERCLQKDPSLRYQSVDELGAVLAPMANGGIVAPPPMLGHTMPDIAPLGTVATSTTLRGASGVMEGPRSSGPGRRVLVIGGVAAVTLGIAGGLLIGFGRTGLDSGKDAPRHAAVTTGDKSPGLGEKSPGSNAVQASVPAGDGSAGSARSSSDSPALTPTPVAVPAVPASGSAAGSGSADVQVATPAVPAHQAHAQPSQASQVKPKPKPQPHSQSPGQPPGQAHEEDLGASRE